jgi:hypothetical protein
MISVCEKCKDRRYIYRTKGFDCEIEIIKESCHACKKEHDLNFEDRYKLTLVECGVNKEFLLLVHGRSNILLTIFHCPCSAAKDPDDLRAWIKKCKEALDTGCIE